MNILFLAAYFPRVHQHLLNMLTAHKTVARHLFFLVEVTRFFDNSPLTTWRTNPRLQLTVDWLTEKLDLKAKLAEFGGRTPKEGSTWNDVELVDPVGKYVANYLICANLPQHRWCRTLCKIG